MTKNPSSVSHSLAFMYVLQSDVPSQTNHAKIQDTLLVPTLTTTTPEFPGTTIFGDIIWYHPVKSEAISGKRGKYFRKMGRFHKYFLVL
jgi:hypothetical protein